MEAAGQGVDADHVGFVMRALRCFCRSDTVQNVRAGPSAVLLLIAIALAVCGGVSARPSKLDGRRSQPVPPAFLVTVAKRVLGLLADPSPTSASLVLTTHGAAAKLGGGAITRGADRPAYVVVLTGTFVYERARGGPGRPTPRGTVARVTVDVASGQSVGLGLSNNPVDLAPLGPVGDLMPYLRGELTPACGAPDLKATTAFQGATGSLMGGLRVTNVSGRKCTLPKVPRVSMLAQGKTLAVKQVRFPPGWIERIHRYRPLAALKARQVGLVMLRWWHYREHCRAKLTESPQWVVLRLPKGLGRVSARMEPGLARFFCNVPQSTLAVGPFMQPL